MFTAIRIQGLAAHDDTTIHLDHAGDTTLAGPSEAGKSSVLEAICFALYGTDSQGRPFPDALIRDGAKRADVTLTTEKGTEIRRTMTRSRSSRRMMADTEYATESAFAEALRALGREVSADGRKVAVGRLLLTPMSWVPMAQGNARGLRDVLDAATPGGDLRTVVSALMGGDLRDDDPLDLKAAESARTVARRGADSAEGAYEQSRTAALGFENDGLLPVVDEQAVEASRAVLRRAEAWADHDEALGRYARMVEAEYAAVERVEAWRSRRETIGDRPDLDAEAETRARAVLDQARIDWRGAEQRYKDAAGKLDGLEARGIDKHVTDEANALTVLDKAKEALERAKAAAGTDVCPTCQRPGWTGPADLVEQARKAVAVAERKASEEVKSANQCRKGRQKELDERIAKGKAYVEERRIEAEAAQDAMFAAEKAVDAARDSLSALRSWEAAMSALGPEPSPAIPPGDPPAEPDLYRPSEEEVQAAREAIRQSVVAAGAAAESARLRDHAVAESNAAKSRMKVAQEKAAHLDALVDAIRRAPSERLRANLAALGDLGPVSIRVPEEGSATVEILIDGRPWWCASTGRQVVADLWLRLALRRALKMQKVPVFVDRVQDWSGAWPLSDGPVVWLSTEAVDGLEVRLQAVGRAA